MTEFISRRKTPEFSLEDLRSPAGRSGLLCVSQSTWMLAYSLVLHYGYWRSRYYKLDVDGTMLELEDSEWTEVTDFVDLAVEELSMTGCSEIVELLGDIAATAAATAATASHVNQRPAHDGAVSIGQLGDQFSTQSAYRDAKCAIANAIYDTINTFVVDRNEKQDLELLLTGVAGGSTAIIAGLLIASGPLGWAIAGVSSSIVLLTFYLYRSVIDFDKLESALSEQHSALVTTLFNASNTGGAKASFLSALSAATTPPSDDGIDLLDAILTSDMLNQLFDPRSDMSTYTSPNPVDCCPGYDHLILVINSNTPYGAGVFVGSDKFEIGDSVQISSVEENDCEGRYLIACTLQSSVCVEIEATVSTSINSFSDYSSLESCVANFSFMNDIDWQNQKAVADSSTAPTWSSVAGVANIAMRSGAPFTATITRVA